MDKYATARIVNAIVTFFGWVAIALAAYVLLKAVGGGVLLASLTVALPLALGGLGLVAVAQTASAQLDTAENTARIARLTETLVNRLSSQPAAPAPAQTAPPPQRRPDPEPGVGDIVSTHKGREIRREPTGFSIDGQPFGNVPAAKAWIEAQSLLRPDSSR